MEKNIILPKVWLIWRMDYLTLVAEVQKKILIKKKTFGGTLWEQIY